MSLLDLLVLLLGSSLLSAGLTSWISWLISKANYKREYYKKLIDRRLDAYEHVEGIINSLSTLVHTDEGGLCPFVCAGGEARWTSFLFDVLKTGSKSVWLGHEISGLMTELNTFMLNDIANHLAETGDNTEHLERLGIMHREAFRQRRTKLQEVLYRDLKDLSNIKAFVERKRKAQNFPLFPKS
ncbi:MAG: hypothetical protein QM724_04035 [Flavobacteriales bacterium]